MRVWGLFIVLPDMTHASIRVEKCAGSGRVSRIKYHHPLQLNGSFTCWDEGGAQMKISIKAEASLKVNVSFTSC